MASPIGYDGGLTCALPVSDLKRSLAWYQEVLGFKLLYHMEEMAWAELETEVARVNLGLSEVEKVEVQGGPTLTFGVKDIEHARKRLESQKVRFDGDIMTIEGMVRLATFYDPDGHKFMLYQSLS